MTTLNRCKSDKEQPVELNWLRFVNSPMVLRSTIVAVLLGNILTLVNQPGWVIGSDPLQILPFILVFLTPFAVVMVAQVAGARQAHIDSAGHGASKNTEGFIKIITTHGIPARAVVIGLAFGTLNAVLSVVDEILRSGDLAAFDFISLAQAYVLPLVFGSVSQAISYKRSRCQLAQN
ncbi:MAG: hypothetical protein V7739_17705 [Motiliproteus sp.]